MDNSEHTILWHDYETWGTTPMLDFPVQFAAIRTNLALEPIEHEPNINLMCKIPHDYLPHPMACLVTGLTPQVSLRRGLTEPEFAKRIYQQISRPNTCVAGYNSMRFDEEVTRHMLFRNLFPVYDREFKNNNSRWDVIDLVRACYALRPHGIKWPINELGKPSFKLESLSEANGIEHADAHDALSDVRATIAIAKLIKDKQPKLYEYYWQLRNKHKVNEMIQQYQQTIFVYVGPYINSIHGCCTLIMPVCAHPENSNAVLCIDLSKPVELFLQKEPEALRQSIFAKDAPLESKPRLISVSSNKCPFVAPIKTLSKERAKTLAIDTDACIENFDRLRSASHLASLCEQIFKNPDKLSSDDTSANQQQDIDTCLYTSEFPDSADKNMLVRLKQALPEQLETFRDQFQSNTLNKVLARYIARNYPGLLDENELRIWQQHVLTKLSTAGQKGRLSLGEYMSEIESLQIEYANQPTKLTILNALTKYGHELSGS